MANYPYPTPERRPANESVPPVAKLAVHAQIAAFRMQARGISLLNAFYEWHAREQSKAEANMTSGQEWVWDDDSENQADLACLDDL